MTTTNTFRRSWQVGHCTVTMSLPANPSGMVSIHVEWKPRKPERLTAAEVDQYRAGRDAALHEWCIASGRTAGVIDL